MCHVTDALLNRKQQKLLHLIKFEYQCFYLCMIKFFSKLAQQINPVTLNYVNFYVISVVNRSRYYTTFVIIYRKLGQNMLSKIYIYTCILSFTIRYLFPEGIFYTDGDWSMEWAAVEVVTAKLLNSFKNTEWDISIKNMLLT